MLHVQGAFIATFKMLSRFVNCL